MNCLWAESQLLDRSSSGAQALPRARLLFLFVGCKDCDDIASYTPERLAGTEDIFIPGEPHRGLLEIKDGRPERQNSQQLGIVQVSKDMLDLIGGRQCFTVLYGRWIL